MRQNKKKRKGIVRELLSWILYLVFFFGVVYLIVQYVGERTVVSGESMYPTLNDGDSMILSYFRSVIRRILFISNV